MQAENAYNIFLEYKDKTNSLLNSVKSPSEKNAIINNTYLSLYKQDPTFLWLAAGTIGSEKVGQNIHLSSIADFSTFDKSKIQTVFNQLPKGNQDIFENIIPIYLTYKKIGIDGINKIKNSAFKADFASEQIYESLALDHSVKTKLHDLANSNNLNPLDNNLMNAFFSDKENRDLALQVATKLMEHEQDIVQAMYTPELSEAFTDPTFIKLGNALGLTGVVVNGKYFSFSDYIDNPADDSQRKEYFRIILTEIADQYAHPDTLKKYLSQVNIAALRSLWSINPFKESIHSINAPDLMERAEAFNVEFLRKIHEFTNEDVASTKDLEFLETSQALLESLDKFYPDLSQIDSSRILEDYQFTNNLTPFDFRPSKSVPLERVDAVFLKDYGVKTILSKSTDLKNSADWEHTPVKNLNQVEGLILPDHECDCHQYTFKNSQFSILTEENQFIAINNENLAKISLPLYAKENQALAVHEIIELNNISEIDTLFQTFKAKNEPFKTEYHTPPPHCGDIVHQINGSTLLYICVPFEKSFPEVSQIEKYLTEQFGLG